ncbi:hypothetical protein ACFFX0_18500 [Citricoccus parietis]|uniref:Uncharacterized protein n=1 Tax=Citricoccus parietis TaxID=592307 RepID=A0ABV5G2D2_9MICC
MLSASPDEGSAFSRPRACGSWKFLRPIVPISRPMPDCLMPPKGARWSSRAGPWVLWKT